MPWTVENPPNPAKNWPDDEKRACVLAANAALKAGKSDKEAIQACLGAGARVKAKKSSSPPGESPMENARVVDLFMADKVLAGEPVRLLPFLEDGYWRWGTKQSPITPEIGKALVGNFEARAVKGIYQSNIPINVEHDSLGGKIGQIGDVILGDDGVYGKLDLTDKGRQMLADGQFDYLSPEIVWDLEDTKTGESVGPFFVGLAVTNYPFFGDATAMFSREAGEHLEAAGPEEGSLSSNQLFAVFRSALQSLGFGPQNQQMEVENMTEPRNEPSGDMQIPEEFTSRLAEMEGQIERFNQMLAERDGQIAAQQQVIDGQRSEIGDLQASRLRERFSRQVQDLAHVGAENGQLVDQLMWLHQADTTEDRSHFAYWSEILSTMENAMAQSVAFQDVGQPGHRRGGTAFSRFSALVSEEAAKRNLVVTEGDANWAKIAMELAETHGDLYAEHMEQTRQRK